MTSANQSSGEMNDSCVIVGAGISGLLAARGLQAAGWTVTVLDKGRGLGGRMATRRVDGATFDHGAQFFTVRSERFQDLVSGWLEAGVAKEWSRGFADASGEINEDGHPRYRGSEGMTSIPKHLAHGLDVRTGERAARVEVREGAWEVACESGARFGGSALLLTAPVSQSLALVRSGDFGLPVEIRQRLEAVAYDPCLALMARLDGPVDVPEPGGMQIKGEPLDWIGDNYQKGISQQPALTIHAGPEWSREHYEDDEAEVTGSLLSLTGEQLDLDLGQRVLGTFLARWRYSWTSSSHPEPYLLASEEPPLLFAGDAFGPGKVEGAALSGIAAAAHLLGQKP